MEMDGEESENARCVVPYRTIQTLPSVWNQRRPQSTRDSFFKHERTPLPKSVELAMCDARKSQLNDES